MRTNGSELRQLTNDAYEDADPVWSPDGKSILYTSMRDGMAHVMLIARTKPEPKGICEGKNPDWAPDGKAIVFVRDGEVIYRVLATGKERRITPEMWDRCAFPVFHPQGKLLALSSRHGKQIGIYLVPLQGGTDPAKTRQVPTRKEACTPRWRPDGKRLLYQTSRHVYEINPQTGKPNDQLTFGGDLQHDAQYVANGKKIVYCRAPDAKGPWSLHLFDLDSEKDIKLPVTGSVLYPDWTVK